MGMSFRFARRTHREEERLVGGSVRAQRLRLVLALVLLRAARVAEHGAGDGARQRQVDAPVPVEHVVALHVAQCCKTKHMCQSCLAHMQSTRLRVVCTRSKFSPAEQEAGLDLVPDMQKVFTKVYAHQKTLESVESKNQYVLGCCSFRHNYRCSNHQRKHQNQIL